MCEEGGGNLDSDTYLNARTMEVRHRESSTKPPSPRLDSSTTRSLSHSDRNHTRSSPRTMEVRHRDDSSTTPSSHSLPFIDDTFT
jgi:hypothetical protein